MSDLGQKWAKSESDWPQIGQNGSARQNVQESDLKNPGCVLFDAHLTNSRPKSDSSGCRSDK